MTTTSEELTELLLQASTETLGRWYCDLNCFRKPADFPIDLGQVDRAHHESPTFMLAQHCVAKILGNEGCSRAWWLYAMKRSEIEWRSWWETGGKGRWNCVTAA